MCIYSYLHLAIYLLSSVFRKLNAGLPGIVLFLKKGFNFITPSCVTEMFACVKYTASMSMICFHCGWHIGNKNRQPDRGYDCLWVCAAGCSSGLPKHTKLQKRDWGFSFINCSQMFWNSLNNKTHCTGFVWQGFGSESCRGGFCERMLEASPVSQNRPGWKVFEITESHLTPSN